MTLDSFLDKRRFLSFSCNGLMVGLEDDNFKINTHFFLALLFSATLLPLCSCTSALSQVFVRNFNLGLDEPYNDNMYIAIINPIRSSKLNGGINCFWRESEFLEDD
ncbi:hypothetical protein L2E82_20570 [Cichorium intybus]|uniref:Uncharacterized protein n=1 Tax=Cichorium intybus TaxID=13427 RepID=A0ACB9DTA0_CICIN|nr:hypothetical protein L2E82_20570 [Cichorium intybus]